MPAIAHLPPQAAMSLFYHVSAVLAFITLALLLYGYIRGRKSPTQVVYNPEDRSDRSRHWLLQGLGVLWFLDGLLQAQPYMVTRFIGGFLAPLLSGQPGPVAWLIHVGLRVWSASPPLFNVFATFVQVGIGLGLLFGQPRHGQRIALWLSLAWGLVVWIAGEGLGGIFVGGAWFTGAPGSVLLYMAAAVLLLMPERWWKGDGSAQWLRWGTVAVFVLNAVLETLPGSGWWGGALSGDVLGMAQMPQPTILSSPLYVVADALNTVPWVWNAVVIIGLVLGAAAFAFWPKNRPLFWFSVLWVFLGWWLGQDFGVLGGMGTDPNTGAILLVGLFTYADRVGLVTLPHLSRAARIFHLGGLSGRHHS